MQMYRNIPRDKADRNQLMRKSAEAVVDAAIVCHQSRGGEHIGSELRLSLVEAVLADPTLTPSLFSGAALNIH